MEKSVFETTEEHSILDKIQDGMNVYDRENREIGTVDRVFLGQASASAQAEGLGPATTHGAMAPTDMWTDILRKTFGKGELPQVEQERLIQSGFLHVNNGLLASDYYVMPSEIAGVAGDYVTLNVGRDELITH